MTSRKVVILGTSSEAMTLALTLMRPEFAVTLIEPDAEACERVQFFLTRLQGGLVRDVPASQVTDSHQPLDTADIVFEALEGDRLQRSDAISRLSLPEQALLATVHRDVLAGFIGFHLFAPTHMRRLVEITLGTGASTQTAFNLAHDMGRIPVLAPAGKTSTGTRLQRRLYDAAEILLLQGAIPHELDEALVAFGFDMGVFEAQDLIGLDVAYKDRKLTARPALISDRIVHEGRLGKQAGVGWYRYPGGGGAVVDPLVEDLIGEEARFAGVEMHEIGAPEMQEGVVRALMDEGLALMAEGVAAADIDTVLTHGLGFPATKGGIIQNMPEIPFRAR